MLLTASRCATRDLWGPGVAVDVGDDIYGSGICSPVCEIQSLSRGLETACHVGPTSCVTGRPAWRLRSSKVSWIEVSAWIFVRRLSPLLLRPDWLNYIFPNILLAHPGNTSKILRTLFSCAFVTKHTRCLFCAFQMHNDANSIHHSEQVIMCWSGYNPLSLTPQD